MPKAGQDTYTPPAPDQCACPLCGTTIPGAPPLGPSLVTAMMVWTCPGCGAEWSEVRQRGRCHRFWDPRPVPSV